MVIGVVGGAAAPGGNAVLFDENDTIQSFSNVLLQSSVDRIQGFDQLVAHLGRVDWTWAGETHTVVVMDETAVQRDAGGNVTFVQENQTAPSEILLGGAGSDGLDTMTYKEVWLDDKTLVEKVDDWIVGSNEVGYFVYGKATPENQERALQDGLINFEVINGRNLPAIGLPARVDMLRKYPFGRIITECPIDTTDGTSVADVAWRS
jgi:hypothetical protein